MLRLIRSWFKREKNTPAQDGATPERLADMLAFAKANNCVGRGHTGIGGFRRLGENIGFQAEPRDIDFRRAHGAYRRDLVVHSPAHVSWAYMPDYAAVGLVDGAVEYRFNTDGAAGWWKSGPTRNPRHIALIDHMFDVWYEFLELPAALDRTSRPRYPDPVDRSDKMALIRQYLENGDPHFLHEVLDAPDADDIILRVDWREDEADIVRMCEAILATGSLSARYLTADAPGDLEISYNGKLSVVRYPGGVADRDTTLLALGAALAPDFEIRYCIDSEGSDTAALLPLRPAQWAILEAAAPDRLDQLFRPLSRDKPIFA